MNDKHGNPLDYFFVLRPMLFFPGWSTLLAGYLIPWRTEWLPGFPVPGLMEYPRLVTGMLLFAMLMGSAFIMNQLRDVASDRANRKLFLIADGLLDRRVIRAEIIILSLTAVILAFVLSVSTGWIAVLFFIVTGILYNYPPFSLKDRPWGSLGANAVMGWLAFALGWSLRRTPDINLLIDSLPYLFFNTALYFFTMLPDMPGDRSAGKLTLAVRWGSKKLIRIAAVVFVAGFVPAVILDDRQALLIYLLTAPLFIRTVWTSAVGDAMRATKFGILIFALSICTRWPPYFILMAGGFFLTKLYFRKRFNMDYPNFKGA